MQQLDISKSFVSESENLRTIFQYGVGYYIPLYQREYSWDSDNTERLMEDLCRTLTRQLSDPETIHFLGVAIFLREKDVANNIQPQDSRALPQAIDNVIDGQQRLSTLGMLAALLYQEIDTLCRQLPVVKAPVFLEAREEGLAKLEVLLDIFSHDLRRGKPRRKPLIVRGSIDSWVLNGASGYKSDLASFFAEVIGAIDASVPTVKSAGFPKLPKGTRVARNLAQIRRWLKAIRAAHKTQDEPKVPAAWELLASLREEEIWSHARPALKDVILNRASPPTKDEARLCELTQLFAFCEFLLTRCCFTVVRPSRPNWAFDMFQSLNATGTPLTAVETFLPYVANTGGPSFKGSAEESAFQKVSTLLNAPKKFPRKNRLTNEFLLVLRLLEDGKKLPNQFSDQRQWLLDAFDSVGVKSLSAPQKATRRSEFVHMMGRLAEYWRQVVKVDSPSPSCIHGIGSGADAQYATTCCLFLESASHPMARSVLAAFYSGVSTGPAGAGADFASAAKATAAFFVLWRATEGTRGLDDVYRHYMAAHGCRGKKLSVSGLRAYLQSKIPITSKVSWVARAKDTLRYDTAAEVCRFVLHLTAFDTILDPANPGLMKVGNPGTAPVYLEPSSWKSAQFGHIEHVAPKGGKGTGWDVNFYSDDKLYDGIGNLTLLPGQINASAGNKGWVAKHIYYQFLAETNPANTSKLEAAAKAASVPLDQTTIDLLKGTTVKTHVAPLVGFGQGGSWDVKHVAARAERMCEITWDRLDAWLK